MPTVVVVVLFALAVFFVPMIAVTRWAYWEPSPTATNRVPPWIGMTAVDEVPAEAPIDLQRQAA